MAQTAKLKPRRKPQARKTRLEEGLASLPRDRPNDHRMAHSDNIKIEDGVRVRLSGALPSTIKRMRSKGMLTAAQCRAAELFIADHDMGYGSGVGVTNMQERVQGGGNRSDETKVAVLDARDRYDNAKNSLKAKSITDVVVGVLINGATLTSAGEYAKRFSGVKSRQTCASTVLGIGLEMLSSHYA